MKRVPLVLLILLSLAAATTAPPENTPSSRTAASPPAEEAAPSQPGWLSYKDPYAIGHDTLLSAHRTADEIMIWANDAAAETLSFGPGDYAKRIADFKKSFVQQSWQQYGAYLQESRLYGMVKDHGYSVNTVVNGAARVRQSGPIGGAYHWLVEVPLIITVSHPDDKGKLRPVSSDSYALTLQIGRVEKGADDNNIVIDHWQIKKSQ